MEELRGKESVGLAGAELRSRISTFESVWIDLGCGDGRFPFRLARSRPDLFVIGIDPARENLRRCATRAARPARRGGLSNLLFIIASVEALPEELEGLARCLTVLFPWGSLLRGLLRGSSQTVSAMAKLTYPEEGGVVLLLNDSLFHDDPLLQRLDLPCLDLAHIERVVSSALTEAGLSHVKIELFPNSDLPYETSWGKKLRESHPRGSTWRITAGRRSGWSDES